MTAPPAASNGSFHGWKILYLTALGQLVSASFTISLIGLYIEPLSTAFSATPGQLGWAPAIFILMGSVLSPVVGHFIDRGHVRLIMTLGAALFALGFFALSQATSLLQGALACSLLLGPGSAMIGFVAANGLLVQWFERRRGLAIGLSAAGMSVGGFLVPPIAAELFALFDWRLTTLLLGAFVALTLLPSAWFIARARPADMGQYPDGLPPSPAAISHQDRRSGGAAETGFRALLARREFWIIAMAMATVNFSSIMLITYLVPFARESGLSMQSSALLLSYYSGAAFFGKFLAGWLNDVFSPRRVLCAICALMALGVYLLLGAPRYLPPVAALIGLAAGGIMPVWATLIGATFGPAAFGRAQGGMALILMVFNVIPGPLGGHLYDRSGSYIAGFELIIWVLLAGLVISCLLPGPGSGPLQASGRAAGAGGTA